MRTSIKHIDSKYFIDEKKGVTVCIISGYTSLLGRYKRFEVKAVSRCHKDDKYNEKYGRRLAESRAKLKMFRLAERRANEAYTELNKMANEVGAIKNANIACQNIEREHLEKIEGC